MRASPPIPSEDGEAVQAFLPLSPDLGDDLLGEGLQHQPAQPLRGEIARPVQTGFPSGQVQQQPDPVHVDVAGGLVGPAVQVLGDVVHPVVSHPETLALR